MRVNSGTARIRSTLKDALPTFGSRPSRVSEDVRDCDVQELLSRSFYVRRLDQRKVGVVGNKSLEQLDHLIFGKVVEAVVHVRQEIICRLTGVPQKVVTPAPIRPDQLHDVVNRLSAVRYL
jgi:hypothetical protein